MKKWVAGLAVGILLAMSSPAFAMEEKTYPYDTVVRVVFGFGHGKKAVQDEEFDKFLHLVVGPALRSAFSVFEAQGQWIHPTEGLILEKNMVIFADVEKGGNSKAALKRIAEEYLRMFPDSNASVYMVESPITSSKSYF